MWRSVFLWKEMICIHSSNRCHRNGTDPDLYPNVNWLKTITKDHVPNGRVSLDINGGTERLRYSMVLAYHERPV